jgi:plasmid stabilization system protein ParE
MVKVEWSERAMAEVKIIFDYLKLKAGDRTARKTVRKIYARPEILADNPQAGQCEELLEGLPVEFRRLVEGNYKIIYFIDETTAVISTVFDCRRDTAALRKSIINFPDDD